MPGAPDTGEQITYAYGHRCVHARAGAIQNGIGTDLRFFMPRPIPGEYATPVQQCVDYEGITWERGWTDGIALLAAHALAMSR